MGKTERMEIRITSAQKSALGSEAKALGISVGELARKKLESVSVKITTVLNEPKDKG